MELNVEAVSELEMITNLPVFLAVIEVVSFILYKYSVSFGSFILYKYFVPFGMINLSDVMALSLRQSSSCDHQNLK